LTRGKIDLTLVDKEGGEGYEVAVSARNALFNMRFHALVLGMTLNCSSMVGGKEVNTNKRF
jgi:hypothetical protein